MSIDPNIAAVALLVSDWDTWQFKFSETKAVCAYLDTLPRTFEAWRDMPSCEVMTEAGAAILAYQAQQIERIRSATFETRWHGTEGKILAVNTPVLQSEVAEALYADEAPAPLRTVASFYREGGHDGWWKFSLRSREDGANVNLLAQRFGGGGHAHAAGFRCPRLDDGLAGIPCREGDEVEVTGRTLSSLDGEFGPRVEGLRGEVLAVSVSRGIVSVHPDKGQDCWNVEKQGLAWFKISESSIRVTKKGPLP